MPFQTLPLAQEPDHIAPDGSEVRPLVQTGSGSMAHFSLPPGAVSVAVAHHHIDELWFFVSGTGSMWRALDGHDQIVAVGPGVSISIPVGTRFQFRADGPEKLVAVGVAMPPWPGSEEAYVVDGIWTPTA